MAYSKNRKLIGGGRGGSAVINIVWPIIGATHMTMLINDYVWRKESKGNFIGYLLSNNILRRHFGKT